MVSAHKHPPLLSSIPAISPPQSAYSFKHTYILRPDPQALVHPHSLPQGPPTAHVSPPLSHKKKYRNLNLDLVFRNHSLRVLKIENYFRIYSRRLFLLLDLKTSFLLTSNQSKEREN